MGVKQAKIKVEIVDVMTLSEVAEYLGKSRATIWRWQKEGKLPALQLGKRLFFQTQDIKKLV